MMALPSLSQPRWWIQILLPTAPSSAGANALVLVNLLMTLSQLAMELKKRKLSSRPPFIAVDEPFINEEEEIVARNPGNTRMLKEIECSLDGVYWAAFGPRIRRSPERLLYSVALNVIELVQ
jgi:hypothetical protein